MGVEKQSSLERWEMLKNDSRSKKGEPSLTGPSVNWEKHDTTTPSEMKHDVGSFDSTLETDASANWSQDEQKALEAAMKKHPASLGPARWYRSAHYQRVICIVILGLSSRKRSLVARRKNALNDSSSSRISSRVLNTR